MTAILPTDLSSQREGKRLLQWQEATWERYVQLRDRYEVEKESQVRLYFYDGSLLVDDMGWEGISHSMVRILFEYIFLAWFSQQRQKFVSLGGTLFEKDGKGAGSPDLVVYTGDEFPVWRAGETRKIDLNRWRVPDLVGEVSDTTLTTDLDEKKRLYASLGIAEYWVVDVKGAQVFCFLLNEKGQYREVSASGLLAGLESRLLEETVAKLAEITAAEASAWFQSKIVGANKHK